MRTDNEASPSAKAVESEGRRVTPEGAGAEERAKQLTENKGDDMTREELKQAAIDCLAKAFKGEDTAIPAHVVQAAVSILVMSEPKP